jgi:hypothetical protein
MRSAECGMKNRIQESGVRIQKNDSYLLNSVFCILNSLFAFRKDRV